MSNFKSLLWDYKQNSVSNVTSSPLVILENFYTIIPLCLMSSEVEKLIIPFQFPTQTSFYELCWAEFIQRGTCKIKVCLFVSKKLVQISWVIGKSNDFRTSRFCWNLLGYNLFRSTSGQFPSIHEDLIFFGDKILYGLPA